MEKPPQFIKEFSKKASTKERNRTAQEIKAKRADYFSTKKNQKDKVKVLEGDVVNKAVEVQKQLEQIGSLRVTLEKLDSSLFTRILKYFQIRKLRADLERGSRTYEQLLQERGTTISEKDFLEAQLRNEDSSGELQEARDMLQEFYAEQKHRWVESDYTKEDIATYFTEEHLSSLSLENYILLLKRFPKNMVTHVTRQGIRDHFAMSDHSADIGTFHDGFLKILQEGRLKSALGIYVTEGLKEASVRDFIIHQIGEPLREESKENDREYVCRRASEWLENFTAPSPEERLDPSISGGYGDVSAVHLATERILDGTYGGETGNEIFFAFPSAHIASQYYYEGDVVNDNTGNWNDQWVWTNEHRGININSGLIFIPENTLVSPDTGSRYELGQDRRPVINESGIDLITKISKWPQLSEFIRELIKVIDLSKPELRQEKIESAKSLLSKEFGINDERLLTAMLTRNNLGKLLRITRGVTDVNDVAKDILSDAGILYREAENPIASKNYWEDYFQQHPKQRPSKVVYYRGTDPSEVLHQWRKDNGIIRSAMDSSIGFPEQRRHEYSPEATQDMDRFRSLARKILDEIIEDQFKNE